MTTGSILLTFLLGASPADVTPPVSGEVCLTVPPEPLRSSTTPFADTRVDGSQVWGAEATYDLSSGDVGEAFMVLDTEGAGEVMLTINGEIVAHVTIAIDEASQQPILTTWVPPEVDYPPEVIAELMRVDLPVVLAELIPQEFKCSAWGKKVMKAGRYMVGAGLAASAAACCLASQGVACLACTGGAWVANEAAGEFANGYCD